MIDQVDRPAERVYIALIIIEGNVINNGRVREFDNGIERIFEFVDCDIDVIITIDI